MATGSYIVSACYCMFVFSLNEQWLMAWSSTDQIRAECSQMQAENEQLRIWSIYFFWDFLENSTPIPFVGFKHLDPWLKYDSIKECTSLFYSATCKHLDSYPHLLW